MKRLICTLLVCALMLSLVPGAALAAEDDYTGKTVILCTGSIRGEIQLYPRIKAWKDDYLAKGADVILADCGNFLQGRTWANSDRGAGVYRLMDEAGYDVANLGLAEFGYTDATAGYVYHGNFTRYYTQAMLQDGTEAVTYAKNRDGSVTDTLPARKKAGFAAICSDFADAKGAYSFESQAVIKTPAGKTIRFVGQADPAIPDLIQDGFLKPAEDKPGEGEEADLTVILSNSPAERAAGEKELVVRVLAEDEPFAAAYVYDNATGEIRAEAAVFDKAERNMQAYVNELKSQALPVVAESRLIFEGRDSKNRNGDTNLGQLTTDALLWYAETYIDGLDKDIPLVALQNGGNLDNFLYTRDVTELDLLRALPFSPMGVGVLYVTGAQLLEAIEAADQAPDCAGFAHVAGMRYTLDTGKDYDGGEAYGKFFRADSIQRVTIDEIGGKPFDPEATYAVVADNYLLSGNDTYYTLKEARDAGAKYVNNGGGVKTRDIVLQYLTKQYNGVADKPYDAVEPRITVLQPQPFRFDDVMNEGDYFFAPVYYAYENQITAGTSDTTFGPYEGCSRAQVVTFLWRSANKPEPKTTDNPFADVKAEDYFCKAVLWAVENGVTQGTGAGTFSPNETCTRAQIVTFLYRAKGSPEQGGGSAFTDVKPDDYFAPAVAWAVQTGITQGTDPGRFSPSETCTRAQVVTFLYRAAGTH